MRGVTDLSPRRRARRSYASPRTIDRAVEAVRANGIRVTSVTLLPDGTITLSSSEDNGARSESLFDALDRAGRL